MNKPINEIVEKWETTGLLQELSSVKKTNCAISLEEMANLLIKKGKQPNENVKGVSSEMIAETLIPIVRRLYNENIKLMPSMQKLYEDYTKFLSDGICEAYVNDLTFRLNK